MRGLIAALRFLTRLPVPGRATTAAELPWALVWFPLVGAALGWLIAGAGVMALGLWPPLVAWALAVVFGLLLTGCFHEDAVADSADALGGGFTNQRVSEILHDSRIGTYGAAALWALLSLRLLTLMELGPAALWAYPLICAWGRWGGLPLMYVLPPGPGSRSAREIGAGPQRRSLLAATAWPLLLCAVVALLGPGWQVALAASAGLPALLLWWAYLRRRLGWQSGDLLGASNQLVEMVGLLAVVAIYHAVM